LSPSDGLASFLKTTLANGVKVVKKVITSKFRFHLIAIYALGCFSKFQLHTCTYQNYLEEMSQNIWTSDKIFRASQRLTLISGTETNRMSHDPKEPIVNKYSAIHINEV
jgi:hypothetical protein